MKLTSNYDQLLGTESSSLILERMNVGLVKDVEVGREMRFENTSLNGLVPIRSSLQASIRTLWDSINGTYIDHINWQMY